MGVPLRGSRMPEEVQASCIQHGISLLATACLCSLDDITRGPRDRQVSFRDIHGTSCAMEEYADDLFSQVRAIFGFSGTEYNALLGGMHESSPLHRATSPTSMRLIDKNSASGKSPSYFLVSAGMAFILKTCTVVEAQLALDLLPSYLSHVTEHRDQTLLPRLYGLYRLRRDGLETFFLVQNNVFAGHAPIHRRYDLKGSHRRASAKELAKGEAIAVRKEADFLSRDAPLRLVGEGTRKSLLGALEADTRWLEDEGLLDYSILLGLAQKNGEDTRPESRYVVRALQLHDSSNDADVNVVYVGIVDILTIWSAKKKAECAVVTLLFDNPSCQPPGLYAARLRTFAAAITTSQGVGLTDDRNALIRLTTSAAWKWPLRCVVAMMGVAAAAFLGFRGLPHGRMPGTRPKP